MTTFQRCTDRGMGDRLNQGNMVFGAVDDPDDETPRQIRGAALAGSAVGAILGGPMAAVTVGAATVAAGAAFAAAKEREGSVGNAARNVEKSISRTGKAIKRSSSFKAIKRSCSFKFSDDSLEAEVRRREAQMRVQDQRQNSNMRRGTRLRRLTGSICQHLRQKHKNLMERARNQMESAPEPGNAPSLEGSTNPRLTASANANLRNNGDGTEESEPRPQRRPSWRLGRRPSAKGNDTTSSTSIDDYVAQAQSKNTKKAPSPSNRRSNRKPSFARRGGGSDTGPSSMNKASPQALDMPPSQRPSLLYRIVKRTVQPYALSQDETRALAHHVSYQVLTTLNHSRPVTTVKDSKVGVGVKENYVSTKEMKLIATHITHEVETAVENSEVIQENALTESEVMALARHIVRQVMMAVSNCTTIHERKLTTSEIKSLAWFMKDQAHQAQAQAYGAIALTARELRSLACWLKLQAHQGLDNTKNSALDNDRIARDMEDFISSMEHESCCSSMASRSRTGRDETKEDCDSDEESCTDYSGSSYSHSEDEGEWVDDYKASPKPPPTYDFETSLSSGKSGQKNWLRMADECGSECGSEAQDHSGDENDDASYDSKDSYDSKASYDSDGSYDSREDDGSRCQDSPPAGDTGSKDKNGDEEAHDESCSEYEESVCGDVQWTKEDQTNDSDDDFEDAVEDANKEEEKREDSDRGGYASMSDLEEASELALQIIEKMLFT